MLTVVLRAAPSRGLINALALALLCAGLVSGCTSETDDEGGSAAAPDTGAAVTPAAPDASEDPGPGEDRDIPAAIADPGEDKGEPATDADPTDAAEGGADAAPGCDPATDTDCCTPANAGAVAPCVSPDSPCAGVRTCMGDTGWGPCTATSPAEEQCNGADDDCDGRIDEGGPGCDPWQTCRYCPPDADCSEPTCSRSVCQISGAPGDPVDCPIHLVRGAEAFDPAVAMNFALIHDAARVTPTHVVTCAPLPQSPDTTCDAAAADGGCEARFGPGVRCHQPSGRCADCGARTLDTRELRVATGHNLSMCTQEPTGCPEGTLRFVLHSVDSKPLSQAFVGAAGAPAGDSLLFAVRYRLEAQGSATISLGFSPEDEPSAASAQARSLPLSLEAGSGALDRWLETGPAPAR